MPFRPREENIFDQFGGDDGGGWIPWQPSYAESPPSFGGGYDEPSLPAYEEFDPYSYGGQVSYEPEPPPSSRYIEPMGMGGTNGSELPSAQWAPDIWNQLAPRTRQDPYIPEQIQPELQWKPTITGGQYQSAKQDPYIPELPSTNYPVGRRDNLGFWGAPAAIDSTSNWGPSTALDLPSTSRQNPLEHWPNRSFWPVSPEDAYVPDTPGGRFTQMSAPGGRGTQTPPQNDIPGLRQGRGGPMYQFDPETAAQERFNKLIGEQPQYRPSLARTILASLAGFGGGMEAGQRIQNEPYARESARWKEAMGPAQQAASLERQYNTEQRQALSQQATAQNAAERNRITEDNNNAKNEIARWKEAKGNFTFDFNGPFVKVLDRDTGEVHTTTARTGALTDWDKMMIQRDTALQVGEQRNQGAMARTQEQQAGTDRRDDSATGGESSSQRKVGLALRASELIDKNPELGQYITFTGTNEFRVRAPEQSFFGGWKGNYTPEMHKRIIDEIYGPSGAPTGVGASTPPAQTPPVGQGRPPAGPIPPAKPYPPGGTMGGGGEKVPVEHEGVIHRIRPGYVLVRLPNGQFGGMDPNDPLLKDPRSGVVRVK